MPGEMLKANEPTAINILVSFYNNLQNNETIPKQWKTGVIMKIPKKGNLNKYSNWRGTTLLSMPYRVYYILILNRISKTIDKKLREIQSDFREKRSCIHHTFMLRNILEQLHE